MKPNDELAFPCNVQHEFTVSKNGDMTLRDYFAAKAMQGLLASYTGLYCCLPAYDCAAREAYGYADAMLAERIK